MRVSGDELVTAVGLFRPRCEPLGDFVEEEKDVLRLKPDVPDVVELCGNGGEPALVLGLVDIGVLFAPNTLPPFKMPVLPPRPPAALLRCILWIVRRHHLHGLFEAR